jgi:hypothetical protein
MKNLLFLTSTVAFLVFSQCSHREDFPNQVIDQVTLKIINSTGEMHNRIVIDYLNEIYFNPNVENARKNTISIIDYINGKYQIKIEENPYFIFGNLSNAKIKDIGTFDPYDFLSINKNKLNIYFYDKIFMLLHHTELVSDNPKEVATIIYQYQENVLVDNNLSEEDKISFLIMLNVYKSSLDLWTYIDNQINEEIPEARKQGVPRNQLWKIPTSDWVGGIGGGILGALPGAIVGLAVSSITMTIGLWEREHIVEFDPNNPNPKNLAPIDYRYIDIIEPNYRSNINYYNLTMQ